MLRRVLSIVLSLVMCFGILTAFPVTVSARNIEIAETGALATPSFSGYNVSNAGIKLTWKAVKGAAKYRVFINSGNSWKKLVDTTALSYTYKAKTGRSYLFTIRCVSANGKKFTSSFNRNGWRIYCLAAPKITRLSSAPTGVNMAIGKVTGATRYRVFVKNGSSWKALGDTTTTTFTHKGAKVGTKYTYTVRCVAANAKFYISDYNRTGWSGTYNPSWSKLYKDFVMNEKYNPYVLNTFASDQSNFKIFLYDADVDGIPELFVNTGYLAVANWHEIFTIKNGKVQYLYRQPMFYTYNGSAPKSKYKGFFAFGAHTGFGAYTYYYIKQGEWKSITVMEIKETMVNSRSHYEVTKITDNTALYKAFLSATKANSNGLREFLYPAKIYDRASIISMGWNAFLRNTGY